MTSAALAELQARADQLAAALDALRLAAEPCYSAATLPPFFVSHERLDQLAQAIGDARALLATMRHPGPYSKANTHDRRPTSYSP